MRKVNYSVSNIIEEIERLKGSNISMEINKGRKKVEKYQEALRYLEKVLELQPEFIHARALKKLILQKYV